MPIQHINEEIEISASELLKLAKFGREIGLTRHHIARLIPKLSKLELMILDSAIKDFDLIKLRNTILILEEPYLTMLQKTTQLLLQTTKDFILE
jgi:hypothetical protein